MSRVQITDGARFNGTHVAESLLAAGHDVALAAIAVGWGSR